MATETVTRTERHKKPKENLPPENERFLRACSDVASALVQEWESLQEPTNPRKDVNLNSLRAKISKKHRLSNIPPLTAIIAAIPEHYKKYILPKLIAKPIRSASGIAVVAVMCKPHRCVSQILPLELQFVLLGARSLGVISGALRFLFRLSGQLQTSPGS
jgi:elongator complex protein 3